MTEQAFFPIISGDLTNTFPDLKQFILNNYTHTDTIKKGGDILFPEEYTFLYLSKGKVKAYMFDESGHERLMYIYIKDTLIFHPVSDDFGKNLVVLEEATLFSVSDLAVFEFLQKDPNHIRSFMRMIGTRYGILLQQALTNHLQNAKHKVYTFLLTLATHYGKPQPDGSILVNKLPTLTDMASIVNVHRSNVTAYFNELESKGILKRQKHQLIVYDMDTLEDLVADSAQ